MTVEAPKIAAIRAETAHARSWPRQNAMTPTEAARLAAVFPLPKKRGAVAPQGFTSRYGNIIAARIGVVGRDGLDACIYKGATAPVNKAPPVVAKKPRPLPGEEFETNKPPPPAETSDVDEPPLAEPTPQQEPPTSNQPAPAEQPNEPTNSL